jgi:hypothetical protein
MNANQELKSGMKNQQLAGVKDAMPQTLIPLTLCFQHGLFSNPDSHMSLTKRMLETQERTPAQKLEQARARVRLALSAAETGEIGSETFDDIARPLVVAMRELEELTITVAVLERRLR